MNFLVVDQKPDHDGSSTTTPQSTPPKARHPGDFIRVSMLIVRVVGGGGGRAGRAGGTSRGATCEGVGNPRTHRFQAKGREWDRVGVVLTRAQRALLTTGLHELEDEHCVVYVALTRTKRLCIRLDGDSALDQDTVEVPERQRLTARGQYTSCTSRLIPPGGGFSDPPL